MSRSASDDGTRTGTVSVRTPAPEVRPGALSEVLQEVDAGAGLWSALRPGAVIGRFELVREVGRGGFGVVYEAKDRELGRLVGRASQFDASPFAPPTGMDLRLHHDHGYAELLRDFPRVLCAGHHLAPWRGHAETAKNLLSLILMNFHGSSVGSLISVKPTAVSLSFGSDARRTMLKFGLVQSGPVYSEGRGTSKAVPDLNSI